MIFRDFDVVVGIPKLGRGLREESAPKPTRIGADRDKKGLGHRTENFDQIKFGLEGRTLVAEPVPAGGLETVLRGRGWGGENPGLGVA